MKSSFLLVGLLILALVGCDIGRGGGGDGKGDVPGAGTGTGTGTGTGAGKSEDGSAKTDPKDSGAPKAPAGAETQTSDGPSSCLLDSGALKLCFEYDQGVAETSSECVAQQGTSSPVGCDPLDAVGVCTMQGPDGQEVRTYYYPPQEADAVKQACEGANGVFSTL